jgi:hypothetical protein
MLFKKEDYGILFLGILMTLISFGFILWVEELNFFTPFAYLFLLVGGFIVLSVGFISDTVVPKVISIFLLAAIFYFLFIFLIRISGKKEGYVFFHVVSGLLFVIFLHVFKLFSQIKFILKRQPKIRTEFIPKKIFILASILILVFWLLFGKIMFPRVVMGLQKPETIATKLYYDSSVEFRIGAYCKDGWESNATGSGACSHHGGVDIWKTKTVYRKSREQCYKEALEISWLE